METPPIAVTRDPARTAARVVVRGGCLAWGFVGLCLAATIILGALAVASSVVLPLFLAVVLAILFRPLVRWLGRHHVAAPLAAGVVVFSLLIASMAFVWMVVVSLIAQADELLAQLEAALSELHVDQSTAQSISDAVANLGPLVAFGVVAVVIAGIDALSGFIAGSCSAS
jgi:predicted PurR-regulated permease PerM